MKKKKKKDFSGRKEEEKVRDGKETNEKDMK